MTWPELANKVVHNGTLYTVHAILGGEYAITPLDRSGAGHRVPLRALENPDDCWCADCDSYAPDVERMAHPLDPQSAWIHTKCPERKPTSDELRAARYRSERAEKERRKRAQVLNPMCRGRPWRAGDHVLMPMRVTGWEGDKLTLEPGSKPDVFGGRVSVVVYARDAYPDHLGALTDEALSDLASKVEAEIKSRKMD